MVNLGKLSKKVCLECGASECNCEVKKKRLTQAEKDAIFERARRNTVTVDPYSYRGG